MSTEQRGPAIGALRVAATYVGHLDAVTHHREVLTRYNITTNRDGSQKEHVETIARKVGLEVPQADS